MPATSDLQIAHIERLNQLPQTESSRFKKGRVAWNRVDSVVVKCSHCGSEMLRKPSSVMRSKRLYCSPVCRHNGHPSPVTDKAVEMYKKGFLLREIARNLECSLGAASTLIYRHKLKKEFINRIGEGKQYVKSRLPKSCELCGYDRFVEVAHIIPSRKGGVYSVDNCFSLCPNCHHLFDHSLLTESENLKLKEIHAARSQ